MEPLLMHRIFMIHMTEDGTDKKKWKGESNEENQDKVLLNQIKSDRW